MTLRGPEAVSGRLLGNNQSPTQVTSRMGDAQELQAGDNAHNECQVLEFPGDSMEVEDGVLRIRSGTVSGYERPLGVTPPRIDSSVHARHVFRPRSRR